MNKFYFVILLCGIVFYVGCGSSESSSKKEEKTTKIKVDSSKDNFKANGEVDYDKLRQKANVAEAASAVGYDGKAIKKELNKIIDDREKMDKQLKDLDL